MQPSQRISNMNLDGSDGWEVFIRARALIEAGQQITELTIGEHDIRTDPSILKAHARLRYGWQYGICHGAGNACIA